MSRRAKTFRLPRVLEMGAPVGSDPVSTAARHEFHVQKSAETLKTSFDSRLDSMMRELWTDANYWRDHGIAAPSEPYPGIEAIRRITTGTP